MDKIKNGMEEKEVQALLAGLDDVAKALSVLRALAENNYISEIDKWALDGMDMASEFWYEQSARLEEYEER